MATNNAINTSTNLLFSRINTQIFTSSGTYTPTAKTQYLQVDICGGGGGSGGSTGAGGQSAAPGGAGGGGYCRKLYTIAQLGANAAVVIGTGGAAGASGNNAGDDGIDSTFTPAGAGVVLTAAKGGGSSGQASTASVTSSSGGSGGTGTNGDLNITGAAGQSGVVVSGVGQVCSPGAGGNSHLGNPRFNNSLTGADVPGATYGTGAAGRINISGANQAGSAGNDGICVITEYISANN